MKIYYKIYAVVLLLLPNVSILVENRRRKFMNGQATRRTNVLCPM